LRLNDHHWQFHIFSNGYDKEGYATEDGCLPMPEVCIREMVADWMGSSYAYTGTWDMAGWLKENLPNIKLHSESRIILMEVLTSIGYTIIE
jgi:hypothetical protein